MNILVEVAAVAAGTGSLVFPSTSLKLASLLSSNNCQPTLFFAQASSKLFELAILQQSTTSTACYKFGLEWL
jgi:hypothetical protein